MKLSNWEGEKKKEEKNEGDDKTLINACKNQKL